MKKCKNCNVKYPDDKKFCKTCGEPLIEIHEFDPEEVTQKALFDISKWLKKNVKNFVGILTLVMISYAVYYFILRHDPIKDANKIALAHCDCFEKFNFSSIARIYLQLNGPDISKMQENLVFLHYNTSDYC